jgi:class 3 adenylate cyclase
MDVGAWLRGLGLGQYEQAFRDNGVDARVLPKLTAEDLGEIGVAAVGHRRLLQEAIAALAEAPGSSDPSVPSATAERAARRAPERRQLTVMFVDLVGSTALSARLDPEEMRAVLRAYQNAVAGEVVRFAGHVAKFMGDGVLAYFGWPIAHEDVPERAVRTGLAVVAAVASLRAPGGEPLAARVGVATGLVVVGDLVGEGAAQEDAVVGDTPNLAARLQALAEPGQVVVAEATRRLLGELFELERRGPLPLKGIGEPVVAFVVRAERPVASRFEELVDRAHSASLALTHRPVRLLSSAASMNLIPLAPSSAVGKSSDSGSRGVPVRRATIASAASRYRVANASW